jgi:hypothetical protein
VHGLVHLLYLGQSARIFELQPGMTWPDHSWVLAGLASPESIRPLASGACVAAAVGFVAGGLGLLAGRGWWQEVIAGSVVFATVAWVVFWDATTENLAGQGAIAIVINAAILLVILALPGTDLLF